ncbi:hypothetical protein B0H19DRAFT_1232238 [Mycena capillaripes]|nr:hypothetical protein B0H19DRAFT_1232238 [Mycena capillaripes]
MLRARKSLTDIKDCLTTNKQLLKDADNDLTFLEKALKTEQDTALKEETTAEAARLREIHKGLNRNRAQLKQDPDPYAKKILDDGIKANKKSVKRLYKKFSRSSEESRLAREKAAQKAFGRVTGAEFERERVSLERQVAAMSIGIPPREPAQYESCSSDKFFKRFPDTNLYQDTIPGSSMDILPGKYIRLKPACSPNLTSRQPGNVNCVVSPNVSGSSTIAVWRPTIARFSITSSCR